MHGHPRVEEYKKRLKKWHQLERKKKTKPATKEPCEDEDADGESTSSEEEADHRVNDALPWITWTRIIAKIGCRNRVSRSSPGSGGRKDG